jgi:hypothetical protein
MGDFGFWSLIHLALVVFAAVRIVASGVDTAKQILWIVIVAVFPLVGLIIWWLAGPGSPNK